MWPQGFQNHGAFETKLQTILCLIYTSVEITIAKSLEINLNVTQKVGWFYWREYFLILFFSFWLHITVSYNVLFHTQILSGNQEMMVER